MRSLSEADKLLPSNSNCNISSIQISNPWQLSHLQINRSSNRNCHPNSHSKRTLWVINIYPSRCLLSIKKRVVFVQCLIAQGPTKVPWSNSQQRKTLMMITLLWLMTFQTIARVCRMAQLAAANMLLNSSSTWWWCRSNLRHQLRNALCKITTCSHPLLKFTNKVPHLSKLTHKWRHKCRISLRISNKSPLRLSYKPIVRRLLMLHRQCNKLKSL